MKVTIQKKEAFSVVGVNKYHVNALSCPEIWAEFHKEYCYNLDKLRDNHYVGICSNTVMESNTFDYMVGYVSNNNMLAKEMGLDVLEISEATYAVVELNGSVPQSIHDGWKYVFEIFFKSSGYSHANAPSVEYYYDGDVSSENYKMELWVPIVKSLSL